MISEQDLLVRLQLAGCKYSYLANKFNKDLLYGNKCTIKDRESLFLLNTYLEILECYKTDDVFSASEDGFQITTLTIGYSLEISIGDLVIFPATISPTSNRNTAMSIIVGVINSTQNIYTATLDTSSDLYKVLISGPCTNEPLTYITDGNKDEIELMTAGMVNGVCARTYDNCFTEDELKTIIDKISILTGLCFEPYGTTYTKS